MNPHHCIHQSKTKNLQYCVGFSFCLSYPLMTQGLIFSMNRTKIVLDHKLLPRPPTVAFSSVRENVIYNIYSGFINEQPTTFIYHVIAIYVPTTIMPLKCHISKLFHMQMADKYVNIYATNKLTAINSVTRSTVIHSFHIIGICI